MFGKLFGNVSYKEKEFNYNEPGVSAKILSKFGSEIMFSCIVGMSKIGETEKLNEFCSHMAEAALHGDELGVVLSCFMRHGDRFNSHLPIPVDKMSEESFEIFVRLLDENSEYGYSESAKSYLKSNKCNVSNKANAKNPYAQWLMGACYAFDNFDSKGQDACMQERINWYEKSAFGGYLPAIQAVAAHFINCGDIDSDQSIPIDFKKASFWFRRGALKGDPMCAYNLGAMYTQGQCVKKNLSVAKMWLSVSNKYCDDPALSEHILDLSRSMGIHMTDYPEMGLDPELNLSIAEFQDAYETVDRTKSQDNYGYKFSEWLKANCSHIGMEPQKIKKWSDVREIRFGANELSNLPPEMSVLVNLVDLSVTRNNFAEIPRVVLELKNLKYLRFEANVLNELPGDIGRLENLIVLSLGRNNLSSLPSSIGNLNKITLLTLYGNKISHLPREIGKMTALKHISLDDNRLSDLPSEILNLNNLESISILDNNFSLENQEKWKDKLNAIKCVIKFN